MSENLTKDELIAKVKQLEARVTQLKNIIDKSKKSQDYKPSRSQRPFDFTKFNTRHVALKIAYLGWDYQGFAVQEDTDRTIEAALFDALLKTRLIESRATSNYHRCGRTDKGVSAFSQVISIDLRTNLSEGIGVKQREISVDTQPSDGVQEEMQTDEKNSPESVKQEIRYVFILNRVLPPEIRVLSWCPVDPLFSARFSCTSRTYKYFFPRGNLDIDSMHEAANMLIGEHDFRNLCKMDVGNGVVSYRRCITSVHLVSCRSYESLQKPCSDNIDDLSNILTVSNEQTNAASFTSHDSFEMFELTIVGQAFLWHQIRCIVAILFLVGQRHEKPEIISSLLDIERNPRKPQYTMAAEFPLILFDCTYDNDDIEWKREPESDADVTTTLQTMWTRHAVRETMLRRMLQEFGGQPSCNFEQHQPDCLAPGNKGRTYKPLFERELCESLEDRIKHYAKRRKRTS